MVQSHCLAASYLEIVETNHLGKKAILISQGKSMSQLKYRHLIDEVNCSLECFIKSHYHWLHIELLQLLEGQLQMMTKSNFCVLCGLC